MDTESGVGERIEVCTRGPSPQLKASLPSFVTWHWLESLIKIGNKKPLTVQSDFLLTSSLSFFNSRTSSLNSNYLSCPWNGTTCSDFYSIEQYSEAWGHGLQPEDLYDLIPKETTIQCQMRWAKAVEDEKQKQNRKGKINGESHLPVWTLLYRCLGNEFMLSSLCYPFWLSSMILQVSSLEFFTIWQNWGNSHNSPRILPQNTWHAQ